MQQRVISTTSPCTPRRASLGASADNTAAAAAAAAAGAAADGQQQPQQQQQGAGGDAMWDAIHCRVAVSPIYVHSKLLIADDNLVIIGAQQA